MKEEQFSNKTGDLDPWSQHFGAAQNNESRIHWRISLILNMLKYIFGVYKY